MNFIQILTENPVLAAVWPPLSIALPMVALCAVSGMGWMVAALQVKSIRSRRAAYGKCAKQLAVLGAVLGWPLLLGSRAWLYLAPATCLPGSVPALLLEVSWTALAVAVVVQSAHLMLWNAFSEHRSLHSALAVIGGICGLLSLVCILGTVRLLAGMDLPNAAALSLGDFYDFFTFPSPLLWAAIATLPMSLSMPAAFALVWLVLRRKQDDFGRDYYNAMVPWCARWSLYAGCIVTLVFLFSSATDVLKMVALSDVVPQPSELALHSARALLPLLSCVLWGVVAGSQIPMRRKLSIWVAFLCFLPSGYFLYDDITSFFF